MAVKPSRLSCPLRKWRPPQTGLSMRRSNRVSSLGHVYFIRLVGERATGGRCLGLPVEHIWLLSRVRLKIIHWRLSPEPPELAGFYVDSVLVESGHEEDERFKIGGQGPRMVHERSPATLHLPSRPQIASKWHFDLILACFCLTTTRRNPSPLFSGKFCLNVSHRTPRGLTRDC